MRSVVASHGPGSNPRGNAICNAILLQCFPVLQIFGHQYLDRHRPPSSHVLPLNLAQKLKISKSIKTGPGIAYRPETSRAARDRPKPNPRRIQTSRHDIAGDSPEHRRSGGQSAAAIDEIARAARGARGRDMRGVPSTTCARPSHQTSDQQRVSCAAATRDATHHRASSRDRSVAEVHDELGRRTAELQARRQSPSATPMRETCTTSAPSNGATLAWAAASRRDVARACARHRAREGAALQATTIGRKKDFLLLIRSEIQSMLHTHISISAFAAIASLFLFYFLPGCEGERQYRTLISLLGYGTQVLQLVVVLTQLVVPQEVSMRPDIYPSSFFRKVPLEYLIYTSCTDPIPQPAAARTPRLHQPSAVTHLFYVLCEKGYKHRV
ncbi:hypothetical protein F511_37060 [Dorcoceras hygrometricum]|uniref:Uncharacterized protein n=1 Tax=Dorcoceras hygrometricum TaxID=472368 RepID=A0A2Z7BUE4_9LAMI|nr:hypothetical protein F511_37060 [Dorcoceras hygrometricum]